MIHPMIGMPAGAEWLVILAIVVLVFGAAKLPELARGTGQALRIFKTETKGLRDDDKDDQPVPPVATTELPPVTETVTRTETTHVQPSQPEPTRPVPTDLPAEPRVTDLPAEPRSDQHPG